MTVEFPKEIFVTGTDTGVGKTVVSAMLCAGLDASYWKPIQAGRDPLTDTEQIRHWSSLPEERFFPERYILERPMSPHAAAEAEDIEILLDDFSLPESATPHLVVEGAGGLLVPINRRETILELIRQLELPVLLVARSGLGTINHTLMSIHMLESSGITLWGVVLNGEKHPSNEDAIRHFGNPPRLFSSAPMDQFAPDTFRAAFNKTFQHQVP